VYIEEIARMAGIGKLGEVEGYKEASRNGWGELAEGR
jgi:hypothetical protein